MNTKCPGEIEHLVLNTKRVQSSLTLSHGLFVAASSVDEQAFVRDEHRDGWRESLVACFRLYFQHRLRGLLGSNTFQTRTASLRGYSQCHDATRLG